MREDKEFLKELLTAPSPSGQEEKALEVWKKFMAPMSTECYSDKMGNSAFKIGQGKTKILLSGHIDQVNARVSLIHDSGLLALHYTGGIDNRSVPSSHLIILTDDGKEIEGIATKKPMHLDKESEWPENYRDFSQIRVDVGCESKEEVEKLGIHPGCLVIYKPDVNVEWGENKICSCSLDDKISVYAVAEIMKKLWLSYDETAPKLPAWALKYEVIGLAATQEETGLRGATVAARNLDCQVSYDLDVDFVSNDELSGPKERIGDIKLGAGPIITYGADKSIRLNKIAKESAEAIGVKYQYASTSCGGTNTDAIQLSSPDCETTHLAIPLMGMHTAVEICNWKDVDGIIDILYDAIVNCRI